METQNFQLLNDKLELEQNKVKYLLDKCKSLLEDKDHSLEKEQRKVQLLCNKCATLRQDKKDLKKSYYYFQQFTGAIIFCWFLCATYPL